MLKPKQLDRAIAFQKAFGIPLNNGSCFGVNNPHELRPEFSTTAGNTPNVPDEEPEACPETKASGENV